MNSRNHTLGTTIKTQISGSETFCSFSGSCHLPLIKMGCWGNGMAWHSVSPARQTLSIWSDCNMHLEDHHVEDMVVNSCELSYLYNIVSSRNKKKVIKQLILWSSERQLVSSGTYAMYLLISYEALSFVTKWKFLFEEQGALFFTGLYPFSYKIWGTGIWLIHLF